MDILSDKNNDDVSDLSEKNDETDIFNDKDNDEFFFYRNNFFNFDENPDESSDESSETTDDETYETSNEDFSLSGIVKYLNFLKLD